MSKLPRLEDLSPVTIHKLAKAEFFRQLRGVRQRAYNRAVLYAVNHSLYEKTSDIETYARAKADEAEERFTPKTY